LVHQISSGGMKHIEELEYTYLDRLDKAIRNNINDIIDVFKRRFMLYNHWIEYLKTEKKRLTDLGIGAERVFWSMVPRVFGIWRPVALFIGSNIFIEVQDAFINVDVKTVYVDNLRDYRGLVEVGEDQTSYPMKKRYGALQEFRPKIKPYYDVDTGRKYSLTYFIQVIYEKPEIIMERKLDRAPIAILLISMPNGLLYDVYGDKIVKHPKSYVTDEGKRIRPANYRYFYSEEPCYKLLQSSKPCSYRVRLYFNKSYSNYYREGLDEPITPQDILSLKKSCNDHNCYIFYFS